MNNKFSPEHKNLKAAKRNRRIANSITRGRSLLAPIIAAQIITDGIPFSPEYGTPAFASVIMLGGATDKVDGHYGRKSQVQGLAITDTEKQMDPFHDKVWAHSMMGAISVRELIEGNIGMSGTILALQAGFIVRDTLSTHSRKNAVEGADRSALRINKWKTGLQNVAHGLACSPLVNSTHGNFIIGATYAASFGMSVLGYRQADAIHKGRA